MLFWQFSNIVIYVKIVGKIPDQPLSVWLFANLGEKVQILVESTGQICTVVVHIFLTVPPGFENNHTFKVDQVSFQDSWHILLCLKFARTTFQCMIVLQFRDFFLYSCWNLMKPGSKSGTYIYTHKMVLTLNLDSQKIACTKESSTPVAILNNIIWWVVW